jgi:hypothetical protein
VSALATPAPAVSATPSPNVITPKRSHCRVGAACRERSWEQEWSWLVDTDRLLGVNA